jgi:lipopolysaccharide export system permease protein
VLVAFGRLSADSEIIAMRAGGVSLWQLLPPVLMLGIFASLLTAAMSSYGEPWGKAQITRFLFKLGETKAAGLVQPRVINRDFFGLVIYADEVHAQESRLEGVFLARDDEKEPFTVHAREGLVVADPEQRLIVLRLLDGTMDRLQSADGSVTRMTFAKMDFNVMPETTVQVKGKDPSEMYPDELYQELISKEKYSAKDWIAFHKKFAYPVGALLMGIVGMALGISDPRHGKGRGYLYGLGVMVLYYVLVRLGDSLGSRKVETELARTWLPVAAAWMPNVVFFFLGIVLFRAQAREEDHFVDKLLARFGL